MKSKKNCLQILPKLVQLNLFSVESKKLPNTSVIRPRTNCGPTRKQGCSVIVRWEKHILFTSVPSKWRGSWNTWPQPRVLFYELHEKHLTVILIFYYLFKDENKSKDGQHVDANILSKLELIKAKALCLIELWSTLKEVFKIPKRELVKMRAEHEREADAAAAQKPQMNRSSR